VERLRLGGGEPLLLEMVHLPAEAFPGLLASDLEHRSLYDLLTERYGTSVARALESLEPVLLPAREAKLLGVRPRSLGLLVEGTACTHDSTPGEFGRTDVRGDRTRYYVDRVVVRSGARRSRVPEPALAG
jgi:GntR family transcriptional regulator